MLGEVSFLITPGCKHRLQVLVACSLCSRRVFLRNHAVTRCPAGDPEPVDGASRSHSLGFTICW